MEAGGGAVDGRLGWTVLGTGNRQPGSSRSVVDSVSGATIDFA